MQLNYVLRSYALRSNVDACTPGVRTISMENCHLGVGRTTHQP